MHCYQNKLGKYIKDKYFSSLCGRNNLIIQCFLISSHTADKTFAYLLSELKLLSNELYHNNNWKTFN